MSLSLVLRSPRKAPVEDDIRPTLSDLVRQVNGDWQSATASAGSSWGEARREQAARLSAEAEWRAAIATLTETLAAHPRWTGQAAGASAREGIVIAGPLPILTDPELTQRFETWVVTPQALADALNGQQRLLPSSEPARSRSLVPIQALPLVAGDPLLEERFCLVLTPTMSLVLVLGRPTGEDVQFQYSFDSQAFHHLWARVRSRIQPTGKDKLTALEQSLNQWCPPLPDFRLITYFSQRLLAHLPHRVSAEALTAEDRNGVQFAQWATVPTPQVQAAAAGSPAEVDSSSPCHDAELLQAMTHEIRTPLTTIRTLTRSLMRRKDISKEVLKRLQRIDQECTQQIDRFNLIFRAVELETTHRDRPTSPLAPIALAHIFQDAIPRWQQQASRRNLSLDVTLPPDLPTVSSDPTLLNQVLMGVVEWFTQCLPAQSHIQMRVMLAGSQLKLQFEAQPNESAACPWSETSQAERPPLRSLGQLLMFAPETGGVSLNLNVTKNLFQSLGGKLTLKQRPQQGDVLTVFLPLETREI